MNGNIQPTVELATTNGNNGFAYPYPVMYGNGGYGNGGLFGGDIWGILLIALLFGNGAWGGFGGFGGFGGGLGLADGGLLGYAIGNNATKGDVSDGFNSLHLSNQIEGVRDDVNDIQNAICSSTASVNSNISNGFYSAEIANANRQMTNMQQGFNNTISMLNGFNNIGSRLDDCLTKILKKAKKILCFTKYKTVGSLIG